MRIKDWYIYINNISELNLKKLNSLMISGTIKGIVVKNGINVDDSVYSVSEYKDMLKEIDNIILQIKMPRNDDSNREKIIFAQLYSILGNRIVYDNYAVSNEGKKDKKLVVNCRNLRNGLLGCVRNGKKTYTSVCAGYAIILQNICAVLGIQCEYIRSNSKIDHKHKKFEWGASFNNMKTTLYYENGTIDPMGHAYNGVVLDGQSYLCDLTWDSILLRANGCVSHFLKSYDDFYDSHHDVGFAYDNISRQSIYGIVYDELDRSKYLKSISLEECKKLFKIPMEKEIEDMQRTGYLCGFVEQYINFIKECKSQVEIQDLYNILRDVSFAENYILSNFSKMRDDRTEMSVRVANDTNRVVSTRIAFYDPKYGSTKEMVESIERRGKRGK